MKKMNKKAFTLIEVIVVVAIIGILVLLGVPRFTGHTQRAELARIQHDVKMMEREMGAEFINGDDFDNWENNIKNLNQLAQDDELFEKEGRVAKDGDPIDEAYKVIPGEYKDKINTKLKGTFYANNHGKVYYEHGEMPGYSDEEIQDLINNGFIPVATADELNNVRYNEPNLFGKGTKWAKEYIGGLDKKYVQVKNIGLSGYSEGEGWNPIGPDSESNFTGTYDGGNYVITDLEIKGANKDNQGLFGYTNKATISNVGLINNKIKVTGANSYVGGLVGYAYSHNTISNSYATGSVEGSNRVGGLVGYAYAFNKISNSYATGKVIGSSSIGGLVGNAGLSTEIINSYATGEVTGSGDYVGGLVGGTYSVSIKNSYAKGSVTGASNVGGLAGDARNSTSISNSYAIGEVTGANNVGGLVGEAFTANGLSVVRNSYATGKVTGTKHYIGGLVGNASNRTVIINSYATGEVTGRGYVGGLMGRVSYSTIENSYATGSATGNKSVGGLVGVLMGNAFSYTTSINNSYATGSVSGEEKVGGFVGEAYTHTTISNSYWNTETTGKSESAGQSAGQGESFGKSTDEMKKKETYEGWTNFDNIWTIQEGASYPTLITNPERH